MQTLLPVATGGLAGVLTRYWMQGALYDVWPRSFPYATIVINVAGCFLIGFVAAAADERGWITPAWRLGLTTGFCGGFTTFSTFSYETIALLRDGELLLGAAYAGGSVVLGLAATVCGFILGRSI